MASYLVVEERFPIVRRSDGKVQMSIPVPHCRYCCKPLKQDFGEWGMCYDCHSRPLLRKALPDRLVAATLYIPDVVTGYSHNREIVDLKEHGSHSDLYAELLVRRLEEEGIGVGEGVIVPSPQTGARGGVTGPQALSLSLSRRTGLAVERRLSWSRPVKHQKTLGKAEREDNMRSSMTAAPADGASRVFLVDDVMTTGATIREGTRALREAGASEVIGVVAARDAGIRSLEYAGVVRRAEG
jgi:predicted amidophosphoribosyltransferase